MRSSILLTGCAKQVLFCYCVTFSFVLICNCMAKEPTITVSFTAADKRLLNRLRAKLQVFKATEILRRALIAYAKTQGIR